MTTRENAPRRGGMVRNFLHLGAGQATTTVMTILLSAMVARALSSSDFGLMYLLNSIAAFSFVVIDWGYGPVIVREISRHPRRAGDLFGSVVAVRVACTLAACPIVFGVTWLLGYEMHTRLLAAAVVLASLPSYLGLSYGWVFRAHERMDREAQLGVALKLAMLLCSMVCLALGGRVPGLILASLVAGLITLAIAIVMHRSLRMPALSASRPAVVELLREGTPIFAMSLAIALQPFFNANILFQMSTPEVVGWYGAAWTIAGTLIAPATVLATAVYPRLSPAAGDPVEFKRIFDVSLRPLFLLGVLGAAGTYLFADVPIALVYSLPKFAPAADTLRAFAPFLLLIYVDMFLSTAVLAVNRSGRLASAKIVSVIVTTALIFVLVPICQKHFANGGLGVAYAMVVGESLMIGVSWVLIREAIDRRTMSDMARALVAGVATVVLFKLLPPITPFLAIPLCVLVFAGLSWAVGAIQKSDFDLLLASFRKRSPAP